MRPRVTLRHVRRHALSAAATASSRSSRSVWRSAWHRTRSASHPIGAAPDRGFEICMHACTLDSSAATGSAFSKSSTRRSLRLCFVWLARRLSRVPHGQHAAQLLRLLFRGLRLLSLGILGSHGSPSFRVGALFGSSTNMASFHYRFAATSCSDQPTPIPQRSKLETSRKH